uniref:CHK kinase-like domain-containing protein n=1 Tax=Graphocephala atropunctata TaxID=36148 RepID=A0A1B6LQF5_9HEMI
MDTNTPGWINESFLTAVLQGENEQKQELSIIKFAVSPAVAPGNNYFSHIYRVQVQYKHSKSPSTNSISLIVKSPVKVGFFCELSEKGNFFGKEKEVYSALLPMLNEKLKYDFGPKSFYCPTKDELVLGDLLQEGYKVGDKYKHLDFSYCKIVIVNIAKFHGASVFLHHEDPTIIDRTGDEAAYKIDTTNVGKPVLELYVKTVARIAKDTFGFDESAEFLLSKVETLWESMMTIVKKKAKGLNVLNHGDLWNNNILFKTDEYGEVVDVKFIDFQFSRYASPVLDVFYFIWTSASQEVQEHRQQELYNIYLQTLNLSLAQLGCKERLTEEELHQDLKASSDMFITILCQLLPCMIADRGNTFKLEDVKNSTEDPAGEEMDENIKKMLSNKRYWTLFPMMLREFHNWLRSV